MGDILYENLVKKRVELKRINIENSHFNSIKYKINEVVIPNRLKKINKSINALRLKALYEILSKEKNISLLNRIKILFKYRMLIPKRANFLSICIFLTKIYYSLKIKEINSQISHIEEQLIKLSYDELKSKYPMVCLNAFKKSLFKYYKSSKDASEFHLKRDFTRFINRYPVIASTVHSLKSCCPDDFLFDLVIIDEASQSDIISIMLAFTYAKRTVIIGDEKQLSRVIKNNLYQYSLYQFNESKLPSYLNYAKHNALSMVKERFTNTVPITLLKNHYRSDYNIIEFCNERYYDNKIIIMNEHKKNNGIYVHFSEVGHCYNRTNKVQVNEIKEILKKLCKNDSIGIISPYRNQVELLKENIKGDNIVIDTVHKFQGKEKDIIILSTVDDKILNYEDEDSDFFNNPNLINVAISRAKKQLYVVGSKQLFNLKKSILNDLYNYVVYQDKDIIEDSIVHSIFDIMQKDYCGIYLELKMKMKRISNYDSENIMYKTLKRIMKKDNFQKYGLCFEYPFYEFINTRFLNDDEKRIVLTKLSYCDFLIYDKISHLLLIDIEVDGVQHNTDIQKNRDILKNCIMKKSNIEVIRYKTNDVVTEDVIYRDLCNILR